MLWGCAGSRDVLTAQPNSLQGDLGVAVELHPAEADCVVRVEDERGASRLEVLLDPGALLRRVVVPVRRGRPCQPTASLVQARLGCGREAQQNGRVAHGWWCHSISFGWPPSSSEISWLHTAVFSFSSFLP